MSIQEQERLQFEAPVPGSSLTTELGSRPWEKPAQFSDPEDALMYYMDQLLNPERMAQAMEILENGFPASALVNAVLLAGVMNGVHTIDTSVVIAPAIQELITGIAEELDVNFAPVTPPNIKASPLLIQRAAKIPEAEQLKEEMEQESLSRIQQATGIMARPVEDLPEETVVEEEKTVQQALAEEENREWA
jgi:hypothetical protein